MKHIKKRDKDKVGLAGKGVYMWVESGVCEDEQNTLSDILKELRKIFLKSSLSI